MDNYAAFNTTPYPAYTTAELRKFVAAGRGNDVMLGEIARREAILAGNVSLRAPGERLVAARRAA